MWQIDRLSILPILMDLVVVCLATWFVIVNLPSPVFPPLYSTESLKIYDRDNNLLREVFKNKTGRSTIVGLRDISSEYKQAVISIEDHRFFSHFGIDPVALCRAAIQNLLHHRIHSGASTITQQLVRMIWSQGQTRSLGTKIREALLAIELEAHYPKDSLLLQYCNRLSFGNNCMGIEAASQYYLGKSASHLTFSDAVYLTALPQNPTLNNPFGDRANRLPRLYKSNCKRLLNTHAVDSFEYARIVRSYPDIYPEPMTFSSPHFVNRVLENNPFDSTTKIITTLDPLLQSTCEKILSQWIANCATYNVTNGAVVVLDNNTGEVMAYVGSADFFNQSHQGQVDGVTALRQPGSSIKPFLFALALDRGLTAATILPDIATRFMTAGGPFEPLNYDKKFHGPVRVRQALACSYNIPAVSICSSIGPAAFLETLRSLGFSSLEKSADIYGPGLALGNGEIRLIDLVSACTIFPRRGSSIKPFLVREKWSGDHRTETFDRGTILAQNIYTYPSIELVEDILSDNDARSPAFGMNSPLHLPFSCAVKTGTSKDYKDNWCIGWTAQFSVGVWVGNFDGSPMHNVSGISGAAPVFFEIMVALDKGYGPIGLPKSKDTKWKIQTICRLSGLLASTLCPETILERFDPLHLVKDTCNFHTPDGLRMPHQFVEWAHQNNLAVKGLCQSSAKRFDKKRILSPVDGDIFVMDHDMPAIAQQLRLNFAPISIGLPVRIAIDTDTFYLNNPYTRFWPLKKGKHYISVLDSLGNVEDFAEFLVM